MTSHQLARAIAIETGFEYWDVVWHVQQARKTALTDTAIRNCFQCDSALAEPCGSAVRAAITILKHQAAAP